MLTLLPFVLAAQLTGAPGGLPKIVVNELCASNATTLLDEDGDASDWVELHNASGASIDLNGWGLTDDVSQPFKWLFPPRVLGPDGYLVVFCSDKNRTGPELHTNFKLSAGGEYLGLVRPNARVEDHYEPAFPAQLLDISYGVTVGISGAFVAAGRAVHGYFVDPTPGGPNGEAGLPVAPVEFSVPHGFHGVAFALELTCATAGAEIHYTLDGSAPSAANGILYTASIPIAATTVVRAVARHPLGGSIARATASTYLFAADILQQTHAGAIARGFPAAWIDQNGVDWTAGVGGTHPGAWYGLDEAVTSLYTEQERIDSLRSLPSVSLAMSIDDWFGYDPVNGIFGIYPNSTVDGPQWERAASMEFIDPNGGPEVQVECGLEIQGGNSTNEFNRSQLSIAMKFLSGFGVKKLEFPMFAGSPVDSFDYLVLDGNRQGSIHAHASLEVARHAQSTQDQYMMDMHRAMGRNSPYGRYVHVYLNGLYWGVYDLHERPDENWAAEHFGGTGPEYDYVKEGFVEEGNANLWFQPEPGAWSIVYDIEQNGLDESDVYGGQPAYDALQDYVDLADYVDYLLLNFWAMNGDWPDRNWITTAHARLSGDFADVNPALQFRMHTWDAELTLGWEGLTAIGHPFYDKTTLRGELPTNIMWLYTELLQHAEFAVLFGDRAQRVLGPGGALHVEPGFDALGTPYDPAFPERNAPATKYWQLTEPLREPFVMEYARWGNYFHAPGDITPADWDVERQRILEDFCAVRSGVLLDQLKNAGLYPLLDPPVLSQHGGPVPEGYDLTLTGPAGALFLYTLDGSDPRLPGGAVAPGALTYSGPLDLLQHTSVKTRALDGAEWSALVEATFGIDYDLVVNEVLADNDALFPDEQGEFEDLIELYNAGPTPVDLSGMFLTDDLGDTRKWPIPAGTVLGAGATLVVWADGDVGQGPLHASFSLSRNGEQVGLFHDVPSGNFALDTLVFGPQSTGVSQGSLPDGGGTRFTLPQPSPGAPNVPSAGVVRPYDARDPARTPASLAHVSGTFAIGQVVGLQVSAAPASTAGFLFLGSGPLAAPFGTGTLLAKSDFGVLVLSTDPAGQALVPVSIPALPALIGIAMYTQAVVDTTFSDALVGTIGP
jgi:chitobiase/beta-hexosaminidase-like protein/lamin tail-like protein/CotH protein